MKKTKKVILAILLSAVIFCGATAFTACGETELPETITGENTIVDGAKGDPAEKNAKYVAYAVAGLLQKTDTFTAQVTGKTVAQKGFITYEQTINNDLIKHGDEFYSCSQSSSAFVNMKHEAFVKNGKVAYRNDGEAIKLAEKANYASVYGVVPGDGIDGHILNNDTIIDAKYNGKSDGLHTYTYVVDGEKGSAAMRKQMKEFGGLGGLPVFTSNSRLTLTIKDDWTPVSLVTEEEYSISVAVLGAMDCTQKLTCTFADFGADTAVPDTDAFNAAMSSTPSVIEPGANTSDPALEGLIGALIESDLAGGVALRGTLAVGGLSLPLDVGASVDIDKIAAGDIGGALKLSVATRIANIDARFWLLDNKLYINAADRKYVAALPAVAIDEASLSSAFKIAETTDGYRLQLSATAKLALGNALKEAGLTDNAAAVDFSIDFYAPGERIGAVTATLACGDSSVTADLTLAERKFSEPQDKDAYKSEISQNISAAVRLPQLFNLDMPIDIDVSYDLSNPDPVSALRASVKIQAMQVSQEGGYELKYAFMLIAMFAPSMGMELPPIITTVSQADVIEFAYLGDGSIYLILHKNVTDEETQEPTSKVFYIEKLSLDSLAGLFDFGGTNDEETSTEEEENTEETATPSLLEMLTFRTDASGLYVDLAGEALAYVQSLFDDLNKTLIAAMGEKGETFASVIGIGNPLQGVEFSIKKDASGYFDSFALTLRVYKLDKDNKEKPLEELPVVDFLQITVDFNGPLDRPFQSIDKDAAMANYAAAKVVIDKIDALIAAKATAENAAELLIEIDATEAAYKALVPDVAIMVTNATTIIGSDSYSIFEILRDKMNDLLK